MCQQNETNSTSGICWECVGKCFYCKERATYVASWKIDNEEQCLISACDKHYLRAKKESELATCGYITKN